MSEKGDLLEYDEEDSVEFIQNYLPQELKGKFTDTDIYYVVDLMYEFYDSKGYMNDDSDDESEVEIDEDEMVAFVAAHAKKEGMDKFTLEEITFIVQGELEYCDSINMFD